MDFMTAVRFPARLRIFLQADCESHPAFHRTGAEAAECECDRSPPSNTEINYVLSSTSAVPYVFMARSLRRRENLLYFILLNAVT
jgi:hypothetical protein